MTYEIIVDNKEKIYDVQSVITVGYWYDKVDEINDSNFEVFMIEAPQDIADVKKDNIIKSLEDKNYKAGLLHTKINSLHRKSQEIKRTSKRKRK